MYVYVKYSALRVKFMRVTLLRAQWEVPRTMPAAERDGEMPFRRRDCGFSKNRRSSLFRGQNLHTVWRTECKVKDESARHRKHLVGRAIRQLAC